MPGFFAGSELKMVKAPQSMVPKCGACGLWKTCQSPKMVPDGGGWKKILVVAEAPGSEEDKQGIQLVGNSGKHLEQVFRKLGINMRRDCWLTNALICRPPDNKINDQKMVDYCRPNLFKTLEALKPHTIVLLGGTAVESFMGRVWKEDVGGITRWVGWNIPCREPNAWVIPTYHPSYLLREKNAVLDRFFEQHLSLAVANKGRPWQAIPDERKAVEIIYNPAKAAKYIRHIINEGGTAAFDYETNMLKPDSDKGEILSCSICWEGEFTIAYPWHGEAITATKEFLQSGVRKVASNLKFEERWSRDKLGVRVKNWDWCTMTAAHVLDNRSDISSIKFQSFVRLGHPPYDEHIKPFLKAKEEGGNNANRARQEVNLEQLLIYNGLDSILEYKVAPLQKKEMGWDDSSEDRVVAGRR